jgi:hypothetical protein
MTDILPEQGAAWRWLRALTDAQQSIVGDLFHAAITEGCGTPSAVLEHARQSLVLRGEDASEADKPGLRRIYSHLRDRETGALAFAEDRLAWSRLTEEEREQLRAESARAVLEREKQRHRERLAAWAQAGGR